MDSTDASRDDPFTAIARQTLDDLLVRHPEAATALGDHRYDDRLDDHSADALRTRRSGPAGWPRVDVSTRMR